MIFSLESQSKKNFLETHYDDQTSCLAHRFSVKSFPYLKTVRFFRTLTKAIGL